MRLSFTLLFVTGLLGSYCALHGGEPVNEGSRATALVAQLGSEDFRAREDAAQALERLGAASLPALRAGLKHQDAEVCRRAAELLQIVERHCETARLLESPRLHLRYKNTPLAEVLADLSKRSGNPLKLDSTREEALKRPITLDGDWSFWEALSRVCEVAGLAEPEPDPPPPPQAAQIEEGFRRGRRVIFIDSSRSTRAPEIETIVLHDLKPTSRPTFQAGAVRIRVFGPRATGPQDKGLETQHAPLIMEVKPEPRIGWERLAAIRIDRVLDNRGQELKSPAVVIGDLPFPDYDSDVMVVWDGHSNQSLGPAPQRFAMHFPVSDRTGKNLNEIHGVVAGWIRTAPEPLVTIDQLAQAVNRMQTGPDGCRLKVVECKREDDGLYKVQIELTPPRSPNLMDLLQGRIIRASRRLVERVSATVDASTSPFVLSNDLGEVLPLVNGTCDYDSNGSSRVYQLVYKPDKNDKGPTKLVYRDRHSAFVEIPFTLKDVPLYKDK